MKNMLVRFISCFIVNKQKRHSFRNTYQKSLYTRTQEKYNIGEGSYVESNTIIKNPKETTIGKYCSISYEVFIGTSQHPTNLLTTHSFTCNSDNPSIDNIIIVAKEHRIDFSKQYMPSSYW